MALQYLIGLHDVEHISHLLFTYFCHFALYFFKVCCIPSNAHMY